MKATITFTRCVQDSQFYGSDDEHMVSRVFFDLEVDSQAVPRGLGQHHRQAYPGRVARTHRDLHVDIKQVVGSDFETSDIEAGPPQGYSGPFNYIAFRDAVERYYRNLVGSADSGIRANIRMRNNPFDFKRVEVFEIDASSAGGW